MSAAESSSEDENIEKLREAAAWSLETGAHHIHKDEEKKGKQSKRIDPSTHEQDGNELQTTPEFRSHVAKKLGAMLDSCLSEMPYEIPQTSSSKSEDCENRDDDEGFRLFSTSLPGKWWKEPSPPPPPKRPPAPSSSDSDSEMEMRLREAAVSISDIIPPSTEKNKEKERMSCRGNDEGIKEPKKKKKKKKAPPEERKEQPLLKGQDEQRTHEQTVDENQVKKKKKKKKRVTEDEGGQ